MKQHRLIITKVFDSDIRPALAGVLSIAVSIALAPNCIAVTDLERGSEAPPLVIVGANDIQIEMTNAEGQTQILLFGDTAHESTFLAIETINHALHSEQASGLAVEWLAILSKSSDVDAFTVRVNDGESPQPIVLHDLGRTAFGAFNVLVTPSVVVLDGERRVIYAVAGPSPRFPGVFLAAVLRAAGKMSEDDFQNILTPPVSAEPSDIEIRTNRWLKLARRLAASGQCDKAQRAYDQALALSPGCQAAHYGLTGLFLGRGDFDAAEAQLLALLDSEPDSDDATIALCFVRLIRGDSDVEAIKLLAQTIADRHPNQASAQILLAVAQARISETDH